MNKQKANGKQRLRRRRHVRRRARGTAERPRLTVFRSNLHIYAQIIDDESGVTLAAASSQSKSLRESLKHGGNVPAAEKVGEAIAEAAKAKGIEQVMFDRGHYKYHGRIKALADAARKGGLQF